ncbi:hypothetical protein ACLB2K_041054 [Fragaria x ananassa]
MAYAQKDPAHSHIPPHNPKPAWARELERVPKQTFIALPPSIFVWWYPPREPHRVKKSVDSDRRHALKTPRLHTTMSPISYRILAGLPPHLESLSRAHPTTYKLQRSKRQRPY